MPYPEDNTQINLFRNLEIGERQQKLMLVIDILNKTMGRNTVKIAAQGRNSK